MATYEQAVQIIKSYLNNSFIISDFMCPSLLVAEIEEDKQSRIPHCFVYEKDGQSYYFPVKPVRLIYLAKDVNLGTKTIAQVLDKAGMKLERVKPIQKLTVEQHIFIRKCVSKHVKYKRFNDFLKQDHPYA